MGYVAPSEPYIMHTIRNSLIPSITPPHRTRLRAFLLAGAFLAAGLARSPADEPTAASKPPAAVESPSRWPDGRVLFNESESERRIRAALDRPARFEFHDTEWSEVASWIEKTYELPVRLDVPSLTALESSGETRRADGVGDDRPLRVALRQLLARGERTFVIRHGSLVITSEVAAAIETPLRIYQVHDLVVRPDDPTASYPELDDLVDQIQMRCGVPTWREQGGTQGECRPVEAPGVLALAVVNTEEVHEEITKFLSLLRAARTDEVRRLQAATPAAIVAASQARRQQGGGFGGFATPPSDAPPPLPPPPPLPRGKVIRNEPGVSDPIQDALNGPAAFDAEKQRLDEYAAAIEKQFRIPVRLDHEALHADGRGPETLIRPRCRGQTLADALDLALDEEGLTWIVRDERLCLTTKTAAETHTHVYVYQMHDLVAHDALAVGQEPDLEYWVEAITSLRAPETWREGTGSPSDIRAYHAAGVQAIVIEQTGHVHRQIEQFLDLVREAHVPQLYEAQRRRPIVIREPAPVPPAAPAPPTPPGTVPPSTVPPPNTPTNQAGGGMF